MSATTTAPSLPAACDFTVFGGTGDLALRKLLPALYLRDREGHLPDDTRIIGVSRSGLDDDGYRAKVRDALTAYVAPALTSTSPRRPASSAGCTTSPSTPPDADDWHCCTVCSRTARRTRRRSGCSTSRSRPSCSARSASACDETAPSTPTPAWCWRSRSATTSPRARAINDEVGAVFAEEQIFRIDHYLGKESVQNLLVTRFANTFLEPLWNSRWVDHVQITVAESLGVGEPRRLLRPLRRAARHGAEPPAAAALPGRHGAADVRRARDRARREAQGAAGAASRCTGADVDRDTVRGQYGAGLVDGAAVPAYADELGHAQQRAPRRSWRSAPRCRTGAGPACRSTCAPASGWTGRRRRSWWSSRSCRTRCSRTARASRRPTGCTSRCSPTRACGCT